MHSLQHRRDLTRCYGYAPIAHKVSNSSKYRCRKQTVQIPTLLSGTGLSWDMAVVSVTDLASEKAVKL